MDSETERTVIDCVVHISGVDASRVTLDTDLVLGLGLAGDDGVDLITAIRAATGVQLRGYDFYQHFGPEAAFACHSPEPITVGQLVGLIETELNNR